MSDATTSFSCRYCSEVFDKKSQRDTHSQSCKPTCTIEYSNMTVTLTRHSTTKDFLCKCTTFATGHTFKTIAGLQKHARDSNCSWVGNSSDVEIQYKSTVPVELEDSSTGNDNPPPAGIQYKSTIPVELDTSSIGTGDSVQEQVQSKSPTLVETASSDTLSVIDCGVCLYMFSLQLSKLTDNL